MIAVPDVDAFVVPPALEAREPAELRGLSRDGVRMLVSDRASGILYHAPFSELAEILRPGDLLVVNDSATLPAALVARRADGSTLPFQVSSSVAATLWIVEPRAPVTEGERLGLPGGATAHLLTPVDARSQRLWYARVDTGEPLVEYLHAHGEPIRYAYVTQRFPLEAYQTIFARVPGSVEMPSAARPFTSRTLASLAARDIEVTTLTLHCGVASAESHEPPQAEAFDVPAQTARAVNEARREGRRVIAVGTTVVRALESAVREGEVVAASGRTELLVSPARPPRAVDGILTGFHEPRASHLAMLSALLDAPDLAAAYHAAIAEGYLWHEFGDVHLIA